MIWPPLILLKFPYCLLQALPVTHDCDIICLSEKFLDSSISNEDERIRIEGYNLLRADHLSNKKRGDVCIYCKELFPIIKRDDLCTFKDCLVTKIIMGKKKLFFSCLYRSASQTKEEFEEFCTGLNLLLSNVNDLNIPLSVITGDFNPFFFFLVWAQKPPQRRKCRGDNW